MVYSHNKQAYLRRSIVIISFTTTNLINLIKNKSFLTGVSYKTPNEGTIAGVFVEFSTCGIRSSWLVARAYGEEFATSVQNLSSWRQERRRQNFRKI